MNRRLNHRATSASKSGGSTSSVSAGNTGLASSKLQPEEQKKTRSVTESGERLPEEERPIITPSGKSWKVTPLKCSRNPATVMGALVREMYPDVINTADGPKPVLRWSDFKKTRTHGVSDDQRVLAEFWWRFKCEESKRAEADRVLELNFRTRVFQMLHEEKKKALKKLYKNGNVPAEEVDEEGNRWPTEEALNSAKPEYFTNAQGWSLLCAHWSTAAFRRSSLLGKRNRLAGGDDVVYHRCGSRSLLATRQHLTLKTGVDPGETGAWLHTHQLQVGTDGDQLCSEKATQNWALYADGMEKKYGPNWKAEHPDFDATVIYDNVGRTPHGRLAIGDEVIDITEKEQIKTRARCAQPHISARELRLERENEDLKRKNEDLKRKSKKMNELECVLRAMAAKGGHDYDALVKETAPDLAASESDVGFSRKDGRGGQQNGTEEDNTGERNNNHDDDDGEDYDGEGENGHYDPEDDDDGEYHGYYDDDGEYHGYSHNDKNGGYSGYDDDEYY